jgi:hypothetical protein
METTMRSRHSFPNRQGEASASPGTRYWMSEFERIHVMTAARLRGERVHSRNDE